MLYRFLAVTRQHPDEPFVGWERLRAEDQPVRDLQRRIQDLEEENAILKKLCTSSPAVRSKLSVHS